MMPMLRSLACSTVEGFMLAMALVLYADHTIAAVIIGSMGSAFAWTDGKQGWSDRIRKTT